MTYEHKRRKILYQTVVEIPGVESPRATAEGSEEMVGRIRCPGSRCDSWSNLVNRGESELGKPKRIYQTFYKKAATEGSSDGFQ